MTKIQLETSDIEQGVAGDCRNCPIAIRIRQVLRPEVDVFVGDGFIDLEYRGKKVVLETPEEAFEFIHNFDDGLYDHSPIRGACEFELDIPKELLKRES